MKIPGIKKIYFYIIRVSFLLFVCSCSELVDDDMGESNAAFTPYVRLYIQNYELHLNKEWPGGVSINFGTTDFSGYCYGNGEIGQVFINAENWIKLKTCQKEILVFHELSHCVINANHREETVNNIPTSWMTIKGITEENCQKYKKEYLIELFTKNSQPVKNAIGE